MVSVGSSLNGCATIGRSHLSQRYMPRDKSELEAGFYIDGCASTQNVALRRAMFERKKVFATICFRPNLPFRGLISTTIS
jgi:hypothetical protein